MTQKGGTEGIRVIHVEDHAYFRDLMKILLNSQCDIELVAQAGSLVEARAQVVSSDIDVAVLDLRQANPDVGVLILSANLDAANLERASDADEIMDKLAPVDEVLGSVRKLALKN